MHFQLNPSYTPTQRVTHGSVDVQRRLQELDQTLDEAVLSMAIQHGYSARLDVTDAHPSTAAGTLHWHQSVATLRTELSIRDWIKMNLKNCPFSVSPDKNMSIIVMTGDSDTGKLTGEPSNQADKGAVLGKAIQENKQYELFEKDAAYVCKNGGQTGTQVWVLLYHVDQGKGSANEIRIELSLPEKFNGKRIIGWTERIILGNIPLDSEFIPLPENQPQSPIDVPVERKQMT